MKLPSSLNIFLTLVFHLAVIVLAVWALLWTAAGISALFGGHHS